MKEMRPLPQYLYRAALVLYPRRLRREYRAPMLQSLRDSHSDWRGGPVRFWLHAYSDLLQSSLLERIYMLRNHAFRRPLVVHTLALAVVLTVLGAIAAVTMQQMLRRGADQPQVDMADWYAGEIGSGEAPADVIPPGYVDLERSLQPFVIFYDDQGKPGAGTGYLDQALPSPPAGVFDFVRSHGTEKVTWQPRPGVRMASVVRRVSGKHPGFLLAARSLRLVEEQESLLYRIVMIGWVVIMGLLVAGAWLLNRMQNAQPSPA